jgi:hypothetical protein
MNSRQTLLAVGAAYAVWEAVDIFWISSPAWAAVFAALFACCTAWFWRRNSGRAAASLLALCGFEAGVAPGLHAETVTKVCDATLGLIGIAAAAVVVARKRRAVHPLRQLEGELR